MSYDVTEGICRKLKNLKFPSELLFFRHASHFLFEVGSLGSMLGFMLHHI